MDWEREARREMGGGGKKYGSVPSYPVSGMEPET